MKSALFSNLLRRKNSQIYSIKNKYYQQYSQNNANNSNSGFTLLEVLVAIVIVGILSAIAAPSWLAFVARQRLNKANDSVLAALQEAQRQAKKTKRSYSVSFGTDNNKQPQIAIHPRDVEPEKYWRNLGEDTGVNSETLLLGTNLEGQNDIKNQISYRDNFDKDEPQTISFNYLGIIGEKKDGSSSDTGLKVLLAIPKGKTPTQASDVKRCVIVETLIGGMRTAKDDDCD